MAEEKTPPLRYQLIPKAGELELALLAAGLRLGCEMAAWWVPERREGK